MEARTYEDEKRDLIRRRTLVASILALVLVPLFGVSDYFLYPGHLTPLLSMRLVSMAASGVIFLVLRGPLGERHPARLGVLLALEVGLAIAGVPVYVTGPAAPHYVSMSLLILSLAALIPWSAAQVALISGALATIFLIGALLHGGIVDTAAFVTQVSAVLITGVLAIVIIAISESVRRKEFAARNALRAASEEKTGLINELKTLNQEMEDLLYVASHDLRAPLINVQGFANEVELGLDTLHSHVNGTPEVATLQEDIQESLRFIQSAVSRMDGLIGGLLNVSRIVTRTNPTEDVPLQRIVEKIIESFRFQLDQRQIIVTVGALPTVRGDPVRLNQVFSNLIDNAIKYMGESPQRSIEIGTRAGNGGPTLFVKDTGPGISATNQEAVFRLFRRLTTGVPGEGLGLTMVRKIVEKHGGRIWIESTPGDGCTFCFTLKNSSAGRDGL